MLSARIEMLSSWSALTLSTCGLERADLAVAPYTTDGDLAIDPARLSEIPPLEQALSQAGFLPKAADSVGVWITHRPTADNPRTEVAIDLLVPASVSPGRRLDPAQPAVTRGAALMVDADQ
jgi:hypothetical protein